MDAYCIFGGKKGTFGQRPVYSQLMMVSCEAHCEQTLETITIKRALAGDVAAWEPIVAQYQQPLFRITYLILRDAAEAEDVTQDCFIRAYEKLGSLKEGQPLKPWLLRIAINLARNRRRGLRRYWQQLQRWDSQQQHTVTMIAGPEQKAHKAERSGQLWQAVGQLSRKSQDVIYLRYFMELSESESAGALDVPVGTIKSRLNRAQRQLRAIIQKDFPWLMD